MCSSDLKRAEKLLEIFLQEKGHTRGGAKAAYAEARLAEARHEMDEAEILLKTFLEGNRNYLTSGDPGIRLKGARLETELRLRQQLVSTLSLNREQALLEEKNDIPILNVLDPGNLPIEKSKPSRAIMVLLSMVMVGLSGWFWSNWEWVRSRILVEDEQMDTQQEKP